MVDTIEVKGIQVNYDYTNNVSVTNSNFNLTDLNSDGIIRIGGKLIIEPNINFEINDKKIQFGKGPNEDKSGILIENGANLNVVDNEGWSPLMRASLVGNDKIVEYDAFITKMWFFCFG